MCSLMYATADFYYIRVVCRLMSVQYATDARSADARVGFSLFDEAIRLFVQIKSFPKYSTEFYLFNVYIVLFVECSV